MLKDDADYAEDLELASSAITSRRLRAFARHHFRAATSAHTASTDPKRHAPWTKPYADPSAHANANPKMNHGLRSSHA